MRRFCPGPLLQCGLLLFEPRVEGLIAPSIWSAEASSPIAAINVAFMRAYRITSGSLIRRISPRSFTLLMCTS